MAFLLKLINRFWYALIDLANASFLIFIGKWDQKKLCIHLRMDNRIHSFTVLPEDYINSSAFCHQGPGPFGNSIENLIGSLFWWHHVNRTNKGGRDFECFGKAYVFQRVEEKPYKNYKKIYSPMKEQPGCLWSFWFFNNVARNIHFLFFTARMQEFLRV